MSVGLGMGRSTGRPVIAEGVGVIAGGGEANPIRRGVTMLQECRSGEALMRFIHPALGRLRCDLVSVLESSCMYRLHQVRSD
jgi:hypothetical protein